MNSVEREYHCFGPWLMEIKNESDLPRQYTEKKEFILSADFSFKVPVNKDRIQMRAGMLLYDCIVSIFIDRVVIFTITNNSLKESVILFKDIQYIIQGGELLRNYIYLVTNDNSYTVNYYSVCYEITSKAMEMLRLGALSVPQQVKEQLLIQDTKLEHLPLYKYIKSKRVIDETAKILAYQPAKKVTIKRNGKGTNIINLFRKNKLYEILVVVNNEELIIVSSDIDHKRKETVDYSYRLIFISINKIIDIKKRANKIYNGVNDLIVVLGEKSICLEVTEDFSFRKVQAFLEKNHIQY